MLENLFRSVPFQPDEIDSECRVSGLRFRVSGFRFRVSGFGFRVSGFGFRVSGFGFQVSNLGIGEKLARVKFHHAMTTLRAEGQGIGFACSDTRRARI